MMSIQFSEEDIKAKVILPYLQSLGFEANELRFEMSFTIRLGRHVYRVQSEEQRLAATGRLDVLVSRQGQHLFIVEAKSEMSRITADDADQGISYARLVHPIAPFVLVTNGREAKLYRTDTKKEITKEGFEIKDQYEAHIDPDAIYEALKHFVGYSPENVKRFCRLQSLEGMKTLLGSEEEPHRKFIPALHVQRDAFRESLQEFLDGDTPAFAVLAESGAGKTCCMCSAALDLIEEGRAVLFYRASDLGNDIYDSIARDFNWEFSTHYADVACLKKLSGLFRGNPVILFVDAIDEWPLENRTNALGKFLSNISQRDVRVVLSCKTAAWSRFVSQRGDPTYVAEYAAEYWLPPLDPREFFALVKRYRGFYGFTGRFEGAVLEECKRSPFLLRVFFEVAQKHRLPHLTFSSIEFYHEYYRMLLEKTGQPEVASNTLRMVARCMYERNVALVEDEAIRTDLGLGVGETLMRDLYDFNVLERVSDGTVHRTRFYFERIRDYVIAFHVLKWPEKPLDEYSADVQEVVSEGIQLDTLKFFYPFADTNKKKVIDKDVRQNAIEYTAFYIKVLDENFPAFRTSFSPHTNGDIGFIGELVLSDRALAMYGFRTLDDPRKERVQFIPIDYCLSEHHSNISYLQGGDRLHMVGTTAGFRKVNVKEQVLRHEIEDQLRDIVEKGLLNEASNTFLLMEKLTAVVCKYQRDLHGIKSTQNPSRYLPIDLQDIEYGMRYIVAKDFYWWELFEEKAKGRRTGVQFSKDERETIEKKAHRAAKGQVVPESTARNVELETVGKVVSEAIRDLRAQGIDAIDIATIPDRDCTDCGHWIWSGRTRETQIRHVLRMYKMFLDEYRRIVETNFPTLKGSFELYSRMPLICFLVPGEDEPERSSVAVREYVCRGENITENMVILCDAGEIAPDEKQWVLTHFGKTYKLLSIGGTSFDSFFGAGNTYTDFEIPYELATLRYLVYHQIESELDCVLDSLYSHYRVRRVW